ncbi:hypothetical protein GUITHDRAFT_106757 [Guillardia theta CCMP2712]|uniref:Alpha 1,4-glycosyltransferase domain-containing protein n=1 Tax=Guillardia theta (strain CCMP2712) TaxID=905079 RepID=L1JG78_GUITC|nr:hypothetical protein GUITHDRAFT_106757 [Guillardia theta CCMP2712]EKX47307.1 hypothetical protein GUITHDRAFT_106757 [Guillardia theta CCMP2712]|eukprot:XP_005834287.1 hypothetical protein GUITHDRAFT_106757 [Guillardia theta CCMP2712]
MVVIFSCSQSVEEKLLLVEDTSIRKQTHPALMRELNKRHVKAEASGWRALALDLEAVRFVEGPWTASDNEQRVSQVAHFIHYYDSSIRPLHACKIEAFLNKNPGHTALVHVKNSETLSRSFPVKSERVQLRVINLTEDFHATPMEEWFQSGVWQTALHKALDLCDGLRLAIIYKYGGRSCYVDLDMVSLNRIDHNGSVLVAMDEGQRSTWETPWGAHFYLGTDFFQFPPRHQFVNDLMKSLPSHFSPSGYALLGPSLFSAVYQDKCLRENETRPSYCNSMTILEPKAFHPVNMFNRLRRNDEGQGNDLQDNSVVLSFPWTERCTQIKEIIQSSIGMHMWDTKRGSLNLDLSTNSMLAKITQVTCPLSYQLTSQRASDRRQQVEGSELWDRPDLVPRRMHLIESVRRSARAGDKNLSSSVLHLTLLARELREKADVEESPKVFSQLYREALLLSSLALRLRPKDPWALKEAEEAGGSLTRKWRRRLLALHHSRLPHRFLPS